MGNAGAMKAQPFWRHSMIKAGFIAATLAALALTAPPALAQAQCPEGYYWDEGKKACVPIPRGSIGGISDGG
jgi:hypothetical protein